MPITDLLAILVPLLPILIPPVVALSALLYQQLVARLPLQKQQFINSLAQTVVNGVEQGNAAASGVDKKAAAVQSTQAILKAMHLSVPEPLIEMAIEGAVYTMNAVQAAPSGAPSPVAARAQPAPAKKAVAPTGAASLSPQIDTAHGG